MLSDPPGTPGIALMALLLDLLLGERGSFLHPVPAMGRIILWMEKGIRKSLPPSRFRMAGMVLPVFLPALFGGGSWLLLHAVRKILGPVAEGVLAVFWGYQLLAARSLYDHVRAVAAELASGREEVARVALSRIVGRDTRDLPEEAIARGGLESLSENTNDALVAPLLFLLLGGVPWMMAYKAVSTLDSMVGYRDERYRDLGWASARTDDLLAFLPARITFFLMMLFLLPFNPGNEGQPWIFGRDSIFREAFRYRLSHPSPNSGYPIAAFAALLGVRLGGGAFYFGRFVEKPVIGAGRDPDLPALFQGLSLYRMFVFSLLVALAGGAFFLWVRS